MLRPAVGDRIRYGRGCTINSNLTEESRGGRGRREAGGEEENMLLNLSCSPCFLVDKTQVDILTLDVVIFTLQITESLYLYAIRNR
jgi:hypothetical protein